MLILLDAQDLQWYRTKPVTARRNITLHNPTPACHTHSHIHAEWKQKAWFSKTIRSASLCTHAVSLSQNKQEPLKARTVACSNYILDAQDIQKTHTNQYMKRQITYWKEECGLAVEQNSSFHACPPRPSTLSPRFPPRPPPSHLPSLQSSSGG